MYTREENIAALEAGLGRPVAKRMACEIDAAEFDMVEGSMRDGRAHDVTMFIRKKSDPSRIAVIRKPFFPPDVFRAPSGAANRGESLEQGAIRESKEETGLDVELIRYVAKINARFTSADRAIDWISHVFEASELSGALKPIDTREIAEARWASLEEIQGPIRKALLDTGWGLFRYRVALTDLTARALEEVEA
ncbi:MAG: NUDIX hydrolase [Candidatus Anoxymicrobium japonicum]|uniref:NUDIX hydrolase n=1 Tax=Candidatus Anoxymicrobium japonicum TaxID=2013648 RepID=A0A2N3G4U8_9ACTN|nr:MAG: NUDIX hydrolase [Candidatus Anoxymicrobium japonicum]